jgi:formylglycine-generating enzyme required for sulfatase activity
MMAHRQRAAPPLLALLTAFALASPQEASVKFPPAPAGNPPPAAVPDAQAAKPEDMKAYVEPIPNTAVKFRMLPIPGGSFLMGSPESEADREDHEGPQVKVEIAPFWMEEHEVTWDEYRIFQFSQDRALRAEGRAAAVPQDSWADAVSRPTPPYVPMDFGMGVEGFPAVCMTEFAARQYTKWLSMKTGRFYRLPTEAEWEYACRAGTTTAWHFGDDPKQLPDYAWTYENAEEKYQLVKTKKPNPWGLHDMHGNVAEWVIDQFTADGYSAWASQEKLVNPVAWPSKLYPRVVRGGSWDQEAPFSRSAARLGSDKEWKVQDPQFPKSIWYFTDARFVGFRIVRPFTAPSAEEMQKFWEADVESVREIEKKQRQGERS